MVYFKEYFENGCLVIYHKLCIFAYVGSKLER